VLAISAVAWHYRAVKNPLKHNPTHIKNLIWDNFFIHTCGRKEQTNEEWRSQGKRMMGREHAGEDRVKVA